ncbi:hypothetical protein [uncultured Aquimarina sp.]|uniref:hypothetical protein n=1 Tax=uncultured Aquimarina sp. TaxID=575652 RepID=UPI0026219CAB|nr:hypothetical protein [uncultured Aquimarina sp.]
MIFRNDNGEKFYRDPIEVVAINAFRYTTPIVAALDETYRINRSRSSGRVIFRNDNGEKFYRDLIIVIGFYKTRYED